MIDEGDVVCLRQQAPLTLLLHHSVQSCSRCSGVTVVHTALLKTMSTLTTPQPRSMPELAQWDGTSNNLAICVRWSSPAPAVCICPTTSAISRMPCLSASALSPAMKPGLRHQEAAQGGTTS
jgi:hypothetical protein